jgi:hypothetical protein
MIYRYKNGGGLSSLPKRTTLSGQDHMLSYITPQEAQMLRREGGGVTPTGGQYRGPGGVPAFVAGMGAGVGAGNPGHAGSTASPGHGQPSSTTSTPNAHANAFDGFGDTVAQHNVDVTADTDGIANTMASLNDFSMLSNIRSKQAEEGLTGMISQNNFSKQPTFSFFGEPQGLVNKGKKYSMQQLANMTPKAFDAISSDSTTSPIGDPNSGFASALGFVAGLTPIGLALGLVASGAEAVTGEQNPFSAQSSIRGLEGLTGLSTGLFSGDSPVSPNSGMISSVAPNNPTFGSSTFSPGLGSKGQAPNIPQQTSPIAQQAIAPPPQTTTVVNEEETISQIPTSLSGIRNRYIGAATGGGIQGLINNQNKDYGVANQDSMMPGKEAFQQNSFTPNKELMDSSYVNNIMQGNAIPMGMHSTQQATKPFDPFPSGGQMNTDNTQHADFSRPQSFYAMPNMNKVS